MDLSFILEICKEVLKDKYVFLIFEMCIGGIFVYGLYKQMQGIDSGILVKRGNETRKYFYEFTIAFSTIVLTEVMNLLNYFHDYKVCIYLVNLGIILYLSIYNGWFKNQLVGIIIKFEERRDSHS